MGMAYHELVSTRYQHRSNLQNCKFQAHVAQFALLANLIHTTREVLGSSIIILSLVRFY